MLPVPLADNTMDVVELAFPSAPACNRTNPFAPPAVSSIMFSGVGAETATVIELLSTRENVLPAEVPAIAAVSVTEPVLFTKTFPALAVRPRLPRSPVAV